VPDRYVSMGVSWPGPRVRRFPAITADPRDKEPVFCLRELHRPPRGPKPPTYRPSPIIPPSLFVGVWGAKIRCNIVCCNGGW